jgi:hypothetical protein
VRGGPQYTVHCTVQLYIQFSSEPSTRWRQMLMLAMSWGAKWSPRRSSEHHQQRKIIGTLNCPRKSRAPGTTPRSSTRPTQVA